MTEEKSIKYILHRLVLVLTLLLTTLLSVQTARATTHTVTNTNNSGTGSLRQAILNANTNSGPDTIIFNIPACAGVCTIHLLTALPDLTDDATTIDGYTQPGAAPATTTTPATLLIEIDLNTIGDDTICGLTLTSADHVVRGLVVKGGKNSNINGICLQGSTTANNTITGNYIGTNASGSSANGNYRGVFLSEGAHHNLIGGDTAAARSVISGNDPYGVALEDSGTNDNVIAGNYIGTDATGSTAVGNDLDGIHAASSASGNVIGGDSFADGNLISGNGQDGFFLYTTTSGQAVADMLIAHNYIGTDATGTVRLSNAKNGLSFWGHANNIIVQNNLISGNGDEGIHIYAGDDDVNTGHQIIGNLIGTDVTGQARLPNYGDGIYLTSYAGDVSGIQIGGELAPDRNVISGNDSGIILSGWRVQSNTIAGNYIGVNINGEQMGSGYGNLYNGILIKAGARNNVIGGVSAGERNVISGNGYNGINMTNCCPVTTPNIYPLTVTDTAIDGNYIGLNASGTAVIGNGRNGIYVHDGPSNNTIGGGTGNVISGNDEHGILLSGGSYGTGVSAPVSDTTISDNNIGLNSNETIPLGNGQYGVYFYFAQGNLVQENIISRNLAGGVGIESGVNEESVGNEIRQNSIFANDGAGIDLFAGANGNILAPSITSIITDSYTVSGTACPGCTIELFANPDDDGEGKTYVGSPIATASGVFTQTLSSLDGRYLTATATDSVKGTSCFSTPTAVPGKEMAVRALLPIILNSSPSGSSLRTRNSLLDQ